MFIPFIHLALWASLTHGYWNPSEAVAWKAFTDGSDLQQFVTRPELKAPRYMVAKHHPDRIRPGYWFVTPYGHLGKAPKSGQKDYVPCMNGPHIYDGDGELIWSGACQFGNRFSFNFRPVQINGTEFLSVFLPPAPGFMVPVKDQQPSVVILDNQYKEVQRISPKGVRLDAHEVNFLNGGESVLITTLQNTERDGRKIFNPGFQELQTGTGKVLFDWNPLSNGVSLEESCDTILKDHPEKDDKPWDFFHINSVDKFRNGDYLVSGRHTSTLYRVSGEDGHIVWRLGGCYNNSDFEMEDGLPFHWQHHGRIRFENGFHTIISVFDNASEDKDRGDVATGHDPPIGKFIILDTASKTMTAKMLRRFDRPDGGQTSALGAVTVLDEDLKTAEDVEKGQVLINWAFEGYISEYDGRDNLVMEAKFVSDRKRSYRAFKYPFTGRPTEPPALKVLPVALSHGGFNRGSVFYVSWNGATEVSTWRFHGSSEMNGTYSTLGEIQRQGFESSWVTPGVVMYAYAEALDVEGKTLGQSQVASIMPEVDPKFNVAYPALKGIDLKSEMYRGPSHVLKALKILALVVVVVFAAYGVYSVLRDLLPRLVRRRRGYVGVATSEKDESNRKQYRDDR